MKIWIAGSVAQYGEEENIKELVKIFDYFDGAFFNVNYENPIALSYPVGGDNTFHQLNSNKGSGKIIWTPWLKRHDWAMNAFLHMVPINDWFLAIDAQELPKEGFLKEMRILVEDCERKSIHSIWWNRPYLIKKSVGMEYKMNPHCWPSNLGSKYINIADESKVVYDDGGVHFGDFLYNKKKRENTLILSGVKYSLYDPPNNQFEMFYKGDDLKGHEMHRLAFCNLLKNKGYSLDLNGLEDFFKNKANITEEIKEYLNFEFVFRDFYRYKILKHSIDEILKNRYTCKIQ